jgi:hypothetical protein
MVGHKFRTTVVRINKTTSDSQVVLEAIRNAPELITLGVMHSPFTPLDAAVNLDTLVCRNKVADVALIKMLLPWLKVGVGDERQFGAVIIKNVTRYKLIFSIVIEVIRVCMVRIMAVYLVGVIVGSP